jgi:hypothetical protein
LSVVSGAAVRLVAGSRRWGAWLGGLGALFALSVPACGSRTGLRGGGDAGAPAVQSCQTKDDCVVTDACREIDCVDTFCQEVGDVECPMVDPCTVGTCDSAVGSCVYEPVTEDLDDDGFLGPLPGTIAGEPGSCGDDCDDTQPLAFPGGTEVCDGVDNDCDRVIDNGSQYLENAAIEHGLRQVGSSGLDSTGGRDLAYGAGTFIASYWGMSDAQRPYFHGLDEGGQDTFEERLVANVNSSSFGADFAFSGMSFGAVLSDNRFGDYEVSFARFDAEGQKLGPDVWLTDDPGFSTHERVIFDQGRFVVVWDDHREVATGGTPRVFAQLIDVDGNLIGDNAPLSDAGVRAELPTIAATPARFGLVHTVLTPEQTSATVLRTYDKSFGDPTSAQFDLGHYKAPSIAAIGSVFLVTWVPYDSLGLGPAGAVKGMLLDERGTVLLPARDLTDGAPHATTPAVLSLGDRALLVWADDRDGNYELYAMVIGLDLNQIEPRTRLTAAEYDSIEPYLAMTETGRVGIMFDDKRTTKKAAYFMTIGCEIDEPDGTDPDCTCDSGCVPGACVACCVK